MKFAAVLALPALVANAASIGLTQQTANVSKDVEQAHRHFQLTLSVQFDDIKVTVPVASLQPIGTYKGLNWDGFNVIDVSLAPVGVAPQTKPNVAVQYILTTGLSNTATLKPASSKTAYFSLQSFYFGCVASSQETAAGVPISCSLTLTGKRKGKTVVTQDVSFSPNGLLGLTSTMKKQTFAGAWTNVDEVDFKQTQLLAAATSVLYDNVQFTTFTL